MNLEIVDNKYILFINNYLFNNYDEKELSKFLKDVFIIIGEIYKIDLFGYFNVDIYVDESIGIYVEIERKEDIISYGKKIDTKVSLSNDSFYLKFRDLSNFIEYSPIYYSDGNYYISAKDVNNILDVIEECEIVYKDYYDFINDII